MRQMQKRAPPGPSSRGRHRLLCALVLLRSCSHAGGRAGLALAAALVVRVADRRVQVLARQEQRRVARALGLDRQALRLEHGHAREAAHRDAGLAVQLRRGPGRLVALSALREIQ